MIKELLRFFIPQNVSLFRGSILGLDSDRILQLFWRPLSRCLCFSLQLACQVGKLVAFRPSWGIAWFKLADFRRTAQRAGQEHTGMVFRLTVFRIHVIQPFVRRSLELPFSWYDI
jgi:hypothetical protein